MNIALQNADEQLRNLGFLRRGEAGFSPVFDVNINPDPGKQRVTSVFGETGGPRSMDSGSWQKHVAHSRKEHIRGREDSRRDTFVEEPRQEKRLPRRNGFKEAEGDIMGHVVDERLKALSEAFG